MRSGAAPTLPDSLLIRHSSGRSHSPRSKASEGITPPAAAPSRPTCEPRYWQHRTPRARAHPHVVVVVAALQSGQRLFLGRHRLRCKLSTPDAVVRALAMSPSLSPHPRHGGVRRLHHLSPLVPEPSRDNDSRRDDLQHLQKVCARGSRAGLQTF
jgi:hypothetical protein